MHASDALSVAYLPFIINEDEIESEVAMMQPWQYQGCNARNQIGLTQ